MLNRLMIGGAVGATIVVGALGIWLGTSGAVDLFADDVRSVTPGVLSYYACPNEGVVGELRGGDRVYLTGRDESGDWVEMRSPTGQAVPVWVRADIVDPDREVELPTVSSAIRPNWRSRALA